MLRSFVSWKVEHQQGTRHSPVGVLLALAIAGWTVAGQPSTFHAETRLVVLHVTVTTRKGELVTDLGSGAFTVYEDGRPQRVQVFRRDDIPVSVGLVIDNSRSMRELRQEVEAAAMAFVRASNPLDDVFVVNFADVPRVDVPFTSDLRALETGIARVEPIGGTALRDAVLMADRYLLERGSLDRRALLVISDGRDNASSASAKQLETGIRHTPAAIYAVRLALARRSPSAHGHELDALADLTGGAVRDVTTAGDIEPAVLAIARQIRRVYTLAYTPANLALDGSYRSVTVKVRPRGLRVRTRPGYWAVPIRAVR